MSTNNVSVDVLVVGCGFGGINAVYRTSQLGLTVRGIDVAGDVGGTWYWNLYPGAMSDTESYLYRYSWDKDDLQTYPWSNRYLYQPEIIAYLRHVVEKHNLRRFMQFGIEMQSAQWDDAAGKWIVRCKTTADGAEVVFAAKYLINSLGVLSRPHYPDIPGRDTFAGRIVHTASWPSDLVLEGKKVGVIGNGSTGLQVMTAIAPFVGKLTSFQRHPQYSVPSGQRPISAEERRAINKDYDAIWERVKSSYVGFGIVESSRKTMEATPAERTALFQEAWDAGNGFRFMFGTFGDLGVDRAANEEACRFLHGKIDELVKDPRKAAILKPRELYARRPVCDTGYYSIFNRENVDVVDLAATPITRIVPGGVETAASADGGSATVHDLDVLVFATGFDAVEGSYQRVAYTGRSGETLARHWTGGPTAYGAVACSGFPNMFLVSGPQGPFANFPPVIESELDLIVACINAAESKGAVVEAKRDAEDGWSTQCRDIAKATLFWGTASWIFGTNLDGREPTANFFLGGLGAYREWMQTVLQKDLEGFQLHPKGV
ncbi:hypothetical protein SCUCBS95973_009860 [Sporothrix curviconia]|uniref:FAD/NAD(P)-binding domain-containing protein n=1 Tax=Sporothrix curviconia TaxID=1260050 RepID=A0ABP0D216_9PEZI